MNKTNIDLLLSSGLNYVHQHFINYCDSLKNEQRRIDIQIKLRKICNKFRGTSIVTKSVLIELKIKLENITFINSNLIKQFMLELEESIKQYNKYYEDDGKRKN